MCWIRMSRDEPKMSCVRLSFPTFPRCTPGAGTIFIFAPVCAKSPTLRLEKVMSKILDALQF